LTNEDYQVLIDKFLFTVKKGLLYDEQGVWIQNENEALRIGVTDYFQRTNGDVTFIELPHPGTLVTRSDEMLQIETIKAVISIHSPIGGTIVEVNAKLRDNPEAINEDPYGKGWLALVVPSNRTADLKRLLTARSYFEQMQSKIANVLNPSREARI
jgi:glycine cleavage system H protein